jgi:hypothetical protein
LLLDLRFARPGQAPALVPAADMPTENRGGGRGAARARGSGDDGRSQGRRGPLQLGDVSEAAGGLSVIDDDWGMLPGGSGGGGGGAFGAEVTGVGSGAWGGAGMRYHGALRY